MLYEVRGHKLVESGEFDFFLLLKYHMIYAFVPIGTVSVFEYPTHARLSQNALLSESLYPHIPMLKNALKCHVEKITFLYPLVGIISEYLIAICLEDQDSLFPGRDLKPGLPTGALPTRP